MITFIDCLDIMRTSIRNAKNDCERFYLSEIYSMLLDYGQSNLSIYGFSVHDEVLGCPLHTVRHYLSLYIFKRLSNVPCWLMRMILIKLKAFEYVTYTSNKRN